jgi:2-polyprenyl-3-methyl-5-hydroxy-6-metoxy-1,4-benzoquinol methylase
MPTPCSLRTVSFSGSNDDFARALAETQYQHLPGGRKKLATLIRLASTVRPDRVLDVGCGNGSLAWPLAALGCNVVGADIDSASIEYCRARNRFASACFVLTDGTLREIDGRFDLIVCSEVLEHLEDPDALISMMCAKLAPAGHLFVTIPNGYGLREIGGRVEHLLRQRLGLERPLMVLRGWLSRHGMTSESDKYRTHTSNPEQGHVQRFTCSTIVRSLDRRGLEVVGWQNSFVIISVFLTRAGLSPLERLDSWAADRLPAALASGWYIHCVFSRDPYRGRR